MADPLAEHDDASTPLSAQERDALIRSDITLRSELNEAEQQNIIEADAWAFSRRRNVLDETFLNTLHKRMYGNVRRSQVGMDSLLRKREWAPRSPCHRLIA